MKKKSCNSKSKVVVSNIRSCIFLLLSIIFKRSKKNTIMSLDEENQVKTKQNIGI